MEVAASLSLLPDVWRHVQWRTLGWLFVGSLLGTPVGVYALAHAPARLCGDHSTERKGAAHRAQRHNRFLENRGTQAHLKNLEVTAFIDPTVPEHVQVDAGRLRQILLNLFGNAVKFTHEGEIALSVQVTTSDPESTSLRFDVRVTGIGIPANRLHTLFRAFTPVDTSTTRRFGGTGLGLSIVKRLAEMMGGEVGTARSSDARLRRGRTRASDQ